jgi:gluconokinase
MHVLVLEASTSTAKAMCYNSSAGTIRARSRPYSPQVNRDGAHDVDGVFAALAAVGREAAEGRGIDAVAVVGTWHNLAVCDASLTPVTPAFTWASPTGREAAAGLRRDEALARRLYITTGCMPSATYPLYKLLHLREQGMDFAGRRVADESTLFFHRLAGEFTASRSALSGSGLLNIQTLDYSDLALELADLEREQLPALGGDFDAAPLSAAGAALLGLRSGIPVTLGQADGAMNQLGAGMLRPGYMTFSMGTSAAVRMVPRSGDFADAAGTWCYYAPATRLCGAATAGAGSCVEWFMRRLAGGKSYAELEEGLEIDESSPYFLPFIYGERCPGWNDGLTGSFAGLRGSHGLRELFGAILEGALFNLYHSYQRLAQVYGEPEEIRVSGGIVKSARWLQMAADIWQRELCAQNTAQASMLGGAMMALNALGALGDLSRPPPGCEASRITRPRPTEAPPYQKRFEIYLERYAHESNMQL